MSDVIDRGSYPKTVTACHAEIKRLEDLLEAANEQIASKDEEIGKLEGQVDDLESDNAEMKDELEEYRNAEGQVAEETAEVINAFLDECERVGPLRYDVPQTDRAMRAIVALHDAVGRNA